MAIEKAEELRGKGGYIYGSPEYISNLNKLFHFYSGILSSSQDVNYYDALHKKNASIKKAVNEIVQDLENNIEIVHLMPRSQREETIDFLKGLQGYLKLSKESEMKIEKAIKILKLSEHKTGYHSRASEREMMEAVKIVYSGSRSTRLSNRDRITLLEKAAKDGIKWAAGTDKNKAAFLNDLAGKNREQKEFFLDVVTLYHQKYTNKGTYKGKRGKALCSSEYITYYEKMIFSDISFKKYMSSPFAYESFFLAQLKGIAVVIVDDASYGQEGKNYIRESYQENMKKWVEELRKCGIHVSGWEEKAKHFLIPDVTEKLFEIMRQAEADGLQNKKKNPNFGDRIKEFIDAVGKESDYDIKAKDDWKGDWYYFDGYILRHDDPGNIVFGVIHKATFSDAIGGKNELFGHLGAGGAQIKDNVLDPVLDEIKESFKEMSQKKTVSTNDGFYNEIFQGKKIEVQANWAVFLDIGTFFDDPRDYEAVELGYEYYENQRYQLIRVVSERK